MHKVLILGAGQLGSRHLQGVLKHINPLNVYVVDPSENSLKIAKSRADEVDHTHELSFLTSLNPSIENIDIAIVATNSKIREKVVSNLLETHTVKYLILEKVLFQELDAYNRISDLVTRKKVKTWVNHPRRMYPIYQKVKNQLQEQNQAKIHMVVCGNNWGLGCNGLHFIDLVCFLNNTNVEKIDTNILDPKLHESKRQGYNEFTGTLTVKFSCGSSLILTSFDGDSLPTNIVIQTNSFKWLIQEGGKSEVDFFQTGLPFETQKLKTLFQSELTTNLVSSLLENGNCDLPAYSEAKNQHISFIDALLSFKESITGKKITHLNIT